MSDDASTPQHHEEQPTADHNADEHDSLLAATTTATSPQAGAKRVLDDNDSEEQEKRLRTAGGDEETIHEFHAHEHFDGDTIMGDLEDDEQLRFLTENLEGLVDEDSAEHHQHHSKEDVLGDEGAAHAANNAAPSPLHSHSQPSSTNPEEETSGKEKPAEKAVGSDEEFASEDPIGQTHDSNKPQSPEEPEESTVAAGDKSEKSDKSAVDSAREDTPIDAKKQTEKKRTEVEEALKIKLRFSPNKALMLLQSLPILDNTSTQILALIGRGSFTETVDIVTDPSTENGQIFKQLVAVYEQMKEAYTKEGFIAGDAIHQVCRSEAQRAVLQRANLTTFVLAVFGVSQVGFLQLNDHFMDCFVPSGQRLPKTVSSLLLDLKTQAYISSLRQSDDLGRPIEEILQALFPEDLSKVLADRRSAGSRTLGAHETSLVERARVRFDQLKKEKDADVLASKYSWMAFVKDVYEYVNKHPDSVTSKSSLVVGDSDKPAPVASVLSNATSVSTAHQPQPQPQQPQQPAVPQMKAGVYHVWNLSGKDNNRSSPAPVPVTNTGKPAYSISQVRPKLAQAHSDMRAAAATIPLSSITGGQELSTAAAYQQARASTQAHTPGLSNIQTQNNSSERTYHRHAWTKEEEAALMDGLDKVQGPHWSQILEYYGAGGQISEALKNRNQVQLKDKARNLKMFFVKSGIEVPKVLQYVTGDAKRTVRSRSKKKQQLQLQQLQQQLQQQKQLSAQSQIEQPPQPQVRASPPNSVPPPPSNTRSESANIFETMEHTPVESPIDPSLSKTHDHSHSASPNGLADQHTPSVDHHHHGEPGGEQHQHHESMDVTHQEEEDEEDLEMLMQSVAGLIDQDETST